MSNHVVSIEDIHLVGNIFSLSISTISKPQEYCIQMVIAMALKR